MSVFQYVDLRCPLGPRRLLGKIRASTDPSETAHVTSNNLLELSCRDCRRVVRDSGERGTASPVRVLHRYDLAGELVETAVEWSSEEISQL